MDIKKEYERWLENATADANVAAELKTLDNAKIEDASVLDKLRIRQMAREKQKSGQMQEQSTDIERNRK